MSKKINELGFVEDFRGEVDAGGTFLQGEIRADYKDLKRIFGEPTDGDGYKIDAHWMVETSAGVGTIYNYKDGKNYCGREGTPKTKIQEWHVGGGNKNTFAWVALAAHTN